MAYSKVRKNNRMMLVKKQNKTKKSRVTPPLLPQAKSHKSNPGPTAMSQKSQDNSGATATSQKSQE